MASEANFTLIDKMQKFQKTRVETQGSVKVALMGF